MSNEIIEKTTNTNKLTYFSYFNNKLYDNPGFLQDEEELIKSNYKCKIIEEDSFSSNQYSKKIKDNENKFIPFNLLDLSPTKQSYKKEKSISINKEKKSEKKEKNSFIKDIKEIKPEFQKYILPKSLFNLNKTKDIQNVKENIKSNNSFSSSSSSSLLVNKLNLFSDSFIPKNRFFPFLIINSPSFFCTNKNNFNLENNNYNYYHNMKKEFTHNERKKNINKKKKKKKEFIEREGDWPCYRCKNLNFAFRNKCNKCKMTKEESEKKYVDAGEELL